jgi:hypothetical protein
MYSEEILLKWRVAVKRLGTEDSSMSAIIFADDLSNISQGKETTKAVFQTKEIMEVK